MFSCLHHLQFIATFPLVPDGAYVVLTRSPQNVFVWCGSSVSTDIRSNATKHATSLLQDSSDDISIQFEVQGQESSLFTDAFEYVNVSPPPPTKTAAHAPDAVVADEEDEDDEASVPASTVSGAAGAAAAPGAAVGGGKKKKKKKKNKNGPGDAPAVPEPPAEPLVEEKVAIVEAKVVAEPVVEQQQQPEEENIVVAAVVEKEGVQPYKPGAAEAAVIAELETKLEKPLLSAEENQNEEEKTPPTAVPTPAAAPVSSPPPLAAPPAAAPRQQVEVKPTLVAAAITPTKATNKTSDTNSSVVAAKTYLADSAKAWGGVGTPPVKSAASVSIPPGTKFFSYVELKELRADSGIDMTAKETYLTDEEFAKVFKKEKSAFLAQPAWRQQIQKKDVGLW